MAKHSPTKYPYNKTANQAQQQTLQVSQVSGQVQFTTPLPPPAILQQYNALIPTFAADLHKEFLKEANHRRSCDKWLIRGGTISAFFGQICAIVIALFGLYVALQLGLAGMPGTAALVVAIDLGTLVGAFLGQKYISGRKEMPEEKDALEPRNQDVGQQDLVQEFSNPTDELNATNS